MTHLVNLAIDPGGYFLAESVTIGTSPEEIEEIRLGRVKEDRMSAITHNLHFAARQLCDVMPMGSC